MSLSQHGTMKAAASCANSGRALSVRKTLSQIALVSLFRIALPQYMRWYLCNKKLVLPGNLARAVCERFCVLKSVNDSPSAADKLCGSALKKGIKIVRYA